MILNQKYQQSMSCVLDAASSQPDPSFLPDVHSCRLAGSSHGGETGERGLAAGWAAAAARVAKFRFSTLARDGRTPPLVSTWTKQSDGMRVPRGKLVLRTSVTGVLVRTGLIGPQSLWVLILSFPTGSMTLVRSRGAAGRAASVSRQPLVWSRDQNSGHVTTHRAAGPHQTAPQSSLSHLHCSRLTTQKCATGISTVEKLAGSCCVHFQLQSGPKIATYSMLGPMPPCSWGWGAMWRMRTAGFQF